MCDLLLSFFSFLFKSCLNVVCEILCDVEWLVFFCVVMFVGVFFVCVNACCL